MPLSSSAHYINWSAAPQPEIFFLFEIDINNNSYIVAQYEGHYKVMSQNNSEKKYNKMVKMVTASIIIINA